MSSRRQQPEKRTCCICLEGNFNKTTRCRSDCIYCGTVYCRACLKQYLATCNDGINCANCAKPWTDDNLLVLLPKTYVEGELRKMKTKHLVEREKQLLPDTMEVAMRYKNQKVIIHDVDQQIDELEAELKQLRTIQTHAYNIRANILSDNNTIGGVNDGEDDVDDNEDEDHVGSDNVKKKKDKVHYFKPCPKDGCNGFLSTHWKCGICDTKVCKDCLEIKIDRHDHECKPEDLASALEVKKNCKACPKCHSKIYKVSGCSQMWCTNCHTAFDWNTNKIVINGIHNPHYYEWMHRANANNNHGQEDEEQDQDQARQEGQGGCNFVNIQQIINMQHEMDRYSSGSGIRHGGTSRDSDINDLLEFHRRLTEIQARLIQDFHIPDVELRNRGLRIKFLVHELDKDEYERQLFLNDKNYLSTRDYNDLHTMVAELGMNTLQTLINEYNNIRTTRHTDGNGNMIYRLEQSLETCMNQVDELTQFYNQQMTILNKKYKLSKQSSFSPNGHNGYQNRHNRHNNQHHVGQGGRVIPPPLIPLLAVILNPNVIPNPAPTPNPTPNPTPTATIERQPPINVTPETTQTDANDVPLIRRRRRTGATTVDTTTTGQ